MQRSPNNTVSRTRTLVILAIAAFGVDQSIAQIVIDPEFTDPVLTENGTTEFPGQNMLLEPIQNTRMTAATVTAAATGVLTVYFSNFGPGFFSPVYNVDGVTPLQGDKFHAELTYDGSPIGGSAFTAVSSSLPFDAPFPGYFGDGSTRQITGFEVGSSVSLQVRAWDTRTGASYELATIRGISDTLTLSVPEPTPDGQPPAMAQWLTGLEPFQLELIPEPGAISAFLGLICILFAVARRPKRGQSDSDSANCSRADL